MMVSTNPGVSQPPQATPFQPGGASERTGTTEQRPKANRPQPRGAASAESQESSYARSKEGDEIALRRREAQARENENYESRGDRRDEQNRENRGRSVDIKA